jgi:hypothetical protein
MRQAAIVLIAVSETHHFIDHVGQSENGINDYTIRKLTCNCDTMLETFDRVRFAQKSIKDESTSQIERLNFAC